MKKIAQLTSYLLTLIFSFQTFGQVNNNSVEHNVKILNEVEQKVYPIDFNFHPKKNTTSQKLASTISPLSQTICSGQAITEITATPNIDSKLNLNCRASAALEFNNIQDNGIFFDITNSSSQPIRINGLSIPFSTPVTTTSATAVPFSIYRTTSATTAEGNYALPGNWTKIADYIAPISSTTTGTARVLTIELGDSGFILNPAESKGIYIVATTLVNGFKIVHRSNATTPTSISDGVATVINRVNSNGLFSTDTNDNVRGFYGNIYYQTGTYGFWSRINATLVTGTGTAGANFSSTTPFPISGTLTNNSTDTQLTSYNITAYNINGTREDHIAEVVVVTSTVSNTITQSGDTLTADQDGATYQWFDCNNGNTPISGATQQSFTPSTNGSYGVTISLSPCQPINSNCTALLDNAEFSKEDFVFYPNPSSGLLKIKSLVDFDLRIINQIGQIVIILPIEASNTEKEIHLKPLSNGVYFLHGISKEGKSLNKKLIISN